MADTKNINKPDSNQTMQHEKAKAEVSGKRPEEAAKLDKDKEKSAIGSGQPGAPTGEPGRARNELNPKKTEPAGH